MKKITLLAASLMTYVVSFSQISDFEMNNDGWKDTGGSPITDFTSVSCDGFLMYRGNSSDFQQSVNYSGFSTNSTSFIGFNRADGSCGWEEMVMQKTFTIDTMTNPTFVMDYYIADVNTPNLFTSIEVIYNDASSTIENLSPDTLNTWANLELAINPPSGATTAKVRINIGGKDAAGFDNIGIFDDNNTSNIDENKLDFTYRVSPNPVVGNNLNVYVSNLESYKNRFIIFGLDGRVVKRGKLGSGNNVIGVNDLKSGIYNVRVNGTNKKIIIK